jgi:hypothetical protein
MLAGQVLAMLSLKSGLYEMLKSGSRCLRGEYHEYGEEQHAHSTAHKRMTVSGALRMHTACMTILCMEMDLSVQLTQQDAPNMLRMNCIMVGDQCAVADAMQQSLLQLQLQPHTASSKQAEECCTCCMVTVVQLPVLPATNALDGFRQLCRCKADSSHVVRCLLQLVLGRSDHLPSGLRTQQHDHIQSFSRNV